MTERLKIVVNNLNDVIPDLSSDFEILEDTEILEADALIISLDVNEIYQECCRTARAYKIPSFVVQHGKGAASDYCLNGKDPAGDYFLAWGESDVKQALDGGWAKDRVMRIGAPIFLDKCKPRPDGKTVVLAPVHHEAMNETNKRNSDESAVIWKALKEVDGIKPVAKLLLGEHDLAKYDGVKFITSRHDKGHVKKTYKNLLKKTSCVVSQIEGTFELLAYSMDIPVVRLKNTYCSAYSSAAKVVDSVEEIEDAVKEALRYPELLREERAEVVRQTGGSKGDNPKASMIRLIKEKVAEHRKKRVRPKKCKEVTSFIRLLDSQTYYRIVQPLQKIGELSGDIKTKHVVKGDDAAQILSALTSDVLVLPTLGTRVLLDMAHQMRKHGKKLVVDFDENIFGVSPYSPRYERFGTENVTLDGVELWKSQYNINLQSNKIFLDNIKSSLELADLVTVSSEELVDVYKRYNDNVKCLPSCMDMDVWQPLPLRKNCKIRIGWHGSAGSWRDVGLMRDSLKAIMEHFPQTVLVLLGARFKGAFKDLPQDRIEYHPYVTIDALPYKLAALNLDIGLLPSQEDRFNKYKSPVKWMEYASLEIPTVCSYTEPYKGLAKDDNGIFVADNDPDAWTSGMKVLIEDKGIGARVIKEATKTVWERFNINKQFTQWVDAYQELF